MPKLLILSLLSLAAACGPITKTTKEKPKAGHAADDDVVLAGGDAAPVVVSTPDSAKDDEAQDAVYAEGTAKGGAAGTPAQSPTQSPTQSPVQTPVESPALTISAIRHAGTMCPDASVAANVSPDRKAFTLLFDSFQLEAPGGLKGATTGGCTLEIDLLSEKGWQLTLLTVDERGYATLNDGDAATLTTDFSFAAAGPKARFTTTLQGALDDNFQRRATANLVTAPWSGCAATKTLRLDLGVAVKTAGDLSAYLAVDSVDGELHHQAGLAFRRCQ
jgi:hypothetical protein